jgi:hypothetical protein
VSDPETSASASSLAAPAGAQPAAAGSIDNRVAARRNVTWKARLMISQGTVLEAKTADISSTGVGLVSHHPLTQNSVVQIALQVPHLTTAGSFTVITGRVKVAFQVMRGGEYRTGAHWVELSEPYRVLLGAWVERLPGKPLE